LNVNLFALHSKLVSVALTLFRSIIDGSFTRNCSDEPIFHEFSDAPYILG